MENLGLKDYRIRPGNIIRCSFVANWNNIHASLVHSHRHDEAVFNNSATSRDV
jgi:hypothetical protein